MQLRAPPQVAHLFFSGVLDAVSWIANILLGGFVFGTALLLTVAIYRRFFHPLSRIPGPRLAAVTNCWLAYQVRNGRMLQLGKTLHAKYGPAVRVGPNEIWFNTKDAFRLIYSPTNGFEKSSFYLATELLKPRLNAHLDIPSPDTLDLLAERDMKRYRMQRRLIGPIYHANNVKRYEAAVDAVLLRVIDQLRALGGSEVDLKEWMHIITVECLGAVSLSWSPGYLDDKSDGSSGQLAYMGWRRKSVFGLFPLAVIIEPLSKHFGRGFSVLWGVTYRIPKSKPFFPAVQKKTNARIRSVLRGKSRDNRRDMTADLIKLHQQRPDEFKEHYLRRMAITNFGAGHETMTSTLTSAFAMLGAHPKVQQRVSREVADSAETRSDSGSGPLFAYDEMVRLRLTQASIREAQRLHPVIGMALPRRVPRGGPMVVHGLAIPPGTTVGCNPVSLHRSRDIFGDDADVFRPERWLGGGDSDGDEEEDMEKKIRAMERYNLIWGGGARTCPGRHLAEMVVSKIVPALVANFEVEVTMPPDEEMPYYFMAMLTGVKARFLPRKVVSEERKAVD
ncbi:cytochrome P450 [Diaporthe helianthi]|uniref:Cytochrome P450 n=1 Tax=Diaporthe helianthi TaxID=158607 RepID=A0A2P5IAU4_DIAHE|nr:cytochrome P450 [Diaporthe helianthi]